MIARLWWKLVRFGFRLLYNECAFTYDWVSAVVSLGEWRCWQQASLAYLDTPSDSLVLELAHGTGNLQLDLYKRGIRTIGYDLSPYMGRIAKQKLVQNRITPRLVQGYAQQLPFPNGAFEAVISTFPTAFIVAPETIAEVRRVLAQNGMFIIVPDGRLTGSGVVHSIIEWCFHITGQRNNAVKPGEDLAVIFDAKGFTVDVQEHPCRRSIAYVVALKKQE